MATGQYRPYKPPPPFLPHTDPHGARPDKVDSLCMPIWGTLKSNIANPKTVPESWEPQDSGTVFGFTIFHFQVPLTSTQSESTSSGRCEDLCVRHTHKHLTLQKKPACHWTMCGSYMTLSRPATLFFIATRIRVNTQTFKVNSGFF